MKTFEQFWDEYTATFNRLPVWLPGEAMDVGDIGIMEPRGWQRLTDLKDIGIPFTHSATKSDVSQSRASGDAVEIRALADAAVGPQSLGTALTGGLEVTFKRGGAFLIRAENCRYSDIQDLLNVQARIEKRIANKKLDWKPRWILVTQVTSAQPAIVLVSKNGDAHARIEVHSNAGARNLAELAKVGGELRMTSENALEQRVVSVKRTPIMWRGRRRGGLFRPGWTDLGEPGSVDTAEATDEPGFVDYLPSGNQVTRDAEAG